MNTVKRVKLYYLYDTCTLIIKSSVLLPWRVSRSRAIKRARCRASCRASCRLGDGVCVVCLMCGWARAGRACDTMRVQFVQLCLR